jgi:pectate lyase
MNPPPPPHGQPEPFDPSTMSPPVRRAPTRPKRSWLPVVGAVVLAAVAFVGGFAVANATATKSPTAFGGNGQGFAFGPGASGRPGRNGGGGFGGGASGTIGTVSTSQMTISTAAGGSRIVLLTPTTTVTQVSSATKALTDLMTGETVTVVGTTNPDGSVTATSVVIGNVGLFGRGGGAPAATTAP